MQKKLLQTLLMAAILSPGIGMAADTIKQSNNQAITNGTIIAQNNECGCFKCTNCTEDMVCMCTPGCKCD
jgi:hypothetical protein